MEETGSTWKGLYTKPEVARGRVIHEAGSRWSGLYTNQKYLERVIHETRSSVDVHRFTLCCKGRVIHETGSSCRAGYTRNRK